MTALPAIDGGRRAAGVGGDVGGHGGSEVGVARIAAKSVPSAFAAD